MTGQWIYDIGAHTGEDSDFYLRKGFNVVAVEAHPGHCETLRRRFAAAIAEGRLALEPFGIGPEDGEAEFYVHSFAGHWHSRYPDKRPGSFRRVRVPYTTYAAIAARHPAPYYLKIDIENSERHVVEAIEPDAAPPYLSIEVGRDWEALVGRLLRLGYRDMQVVEQSSKPQPPNPPREGAHAEVTFTNHHSGPFGRELPPDWVRIDAPQQARAIVGALTWGNGEWYDLHFRHARA